MRREIRDVRGFVNGGSPEANPGFFEVFLSSGTGGCDAWSSDPWESDVLHATFGGDCFRFIHGCDGLWWNREKVLGLEINVVEIEYTSVLHGGRRNG